MRLHPSTITSWFDLDDIRAHIAEQLAAKRACQKLAHFDNSQSF